MELQKTLTDVLYGGGIRIAVRLRGLVFIPLITGFLGVGAFGAYTQVLAVTSLGSLVFGLGLYKSLVRYGHRGDRVADRYISLLCVSLASSLVATVALVAAASWVAGVTLQSEGYGDAYRIGAALILTRTVVRHARNYYRIDGRIKRYSLIEGLRAYAMITAVTLTVVLTDTGLPGLFGGMVVVDCLIIVVLHALIAREIGLAVPTFRNLRQHLAYALPSTWSTLASEITTRADRVLIGVFLGDVALGLYAVTAQIATGISMYIMPIYQTFFPEFSRLLDEDRTETCAEYLEQGARYFLILAIPSVGGLYLVGGDVVELLTQAAATPSPLLIVLVSTGTAFVGVEVIYGSLMDAAEETEYRALYRTAGAVLNVGLNLLAIPRFGVVGAAGATVVTTFVVAGLTIRRVRYLVSTPLPWWTLLRCTGATLVLIWVDAALPSVPWLWTVLLSVPLYFAVLFLSRELSVAELRASVS